MEISEKLKGIADQVRGCRKCSLANSRKNAVPGEGPANAEIMFIGEGPGFHENEQGRPFVGAAGKYLDELLQKGGLNRSEVFITNVVKCRPPGNRDPMPEELSACSPYLDIQMDVINPLVIVTLGRFSMARYFPNVKISTAHGQPMWIRGHLIIPMYHPAAALHQPGLKPALEKDFSQLSKWIEQGRKAKPDQKDDPGHETPADAPPPEQPTQLTLF